MRNSQSTRACPAQNALPEFRRTHSATLMAVGRHATLRRTHSLPLEGMPRYEKRQHPALNGTYQVPRRRLSGTSQTVKPPQSNALRQMKRHNFVKSPKGQKMWQVMCCWEQNAFVPPDLRLAILAQWRKNFQNRGMITVWGWVCMKCNYTNQWSGIECRLCDDSRRLRWACGGLEMASESSCSVVSSEVVSAMRTLPEGQLWSESGVQLTGCETRAIYSPPRMEFLMTLSPENAMRILLCLNKRTARTMLSEMLSSVGVVPEFHKVYKCSAAHLEWRRYEYPGALDRAKITYKYVADILRHTPGKEGPWIDTEFTRNIKQPDRDVLMWSSAARTRQTESAMESDNKVVQVIDDIWQGFKSIFTSSNDLPKPPTANSGTTSSPRDANVTLSRVAANLKAKAG